MHSFRSTYSLCFVLALNYHYDDFSSRISVHLIGPFGKITNESSQDRISIYMQIEDKEQSPKYFAITRTGKDQSKPDKVTFDFDIGNASSATQLNLSMQLMTNAEDAISLQLLIDTHSVDLRVGALCGGIILILLNVLIISEVKMKHSLIYCCNSWHIHSDNICKCVKSTDCSSNTGRTVGCLCIDRNIGCLSRQTNNGRHDQMDWLRNTVADFFHDGLSGDSHRHGHFRLHCRLHIPSNSV